VIHHAPIDLGELIHATQDTFAVNLLNLAIAICYRLL
jgi:hypothetical protein